MTTSSKRLWIFLSVVAMGLSLSPRRTWAEDQPKKPEPKPAGASQKEALAEMNSLASLGRLDLDDMEKFRPGRPKDEILKEVHWTGDFEMATEEGDKTLAAISFYVCLKGQQYGETLWAIFVDDKFTKFVESPALKITFPIPVGSFDVLRQTAAEKPIVFKDFKKQMEALAKPEPNDPGLTATVQPLVPLMIASMGPRFKKNARLRDQFNAARLKLGMTKVEVAAVLKATPLDSGELKVGTFEIYGSTEYTGLIMPLQYKNILVLYRGERLAGIYSGFFAPGAKVGYDSLRKPVPEARLPQQFTGLPPVTAKPK